MERAASQCEQCVFPSIRNQASMTISSNDESMRRRSGESQNNRASSSTQPPNLAHSPVQRFQNIQALRAVAALLVFAHHALAHYDSIGGSNGWFRAMATYGFAGVDIFFVISGFVAAHSTLGKPRTFSEARVFGVRRFLRIYLGYWPFFALALGLALLFAPQTVANFDVARSFFLTSVNLPKLVLFITWSLSYELLFYLMIVASFMLTVQAIRRLIPVAAIVLVAFMLAWYGKALSPLQLFLAYATEFLAGAWVYLHWQQAKGWAWAIAAALVTAAGFGMGVYLNATNNAVHILTFGVAGVGLLILGLVLENSRWWQAGRVWRTLGDSSYTLYLAHLSFLTVFYFSGLRAFVAWQPGVWLDLGFFLCLGLFQILCCWYYLRVEAPLYRWACTWPVAQGPVAKAAAVSKQVA